MKVLYLHGVAGGHGDRMECLDALKREGVVSRLDGPRFAELRGSRAVTLVATLPRVVEQAQRHFDALEPDLVIGSSMGARVAIELRNDVRGRAVPFLLVSPACVSLVELGLAFVMSKAGRPMPCRRAERRLVERVPSGSVILHCPEDSLFGVEVARDLQASRDDVTLVEVEYRGDTPPWRGGVAHKMNFSEAIDEFERRVRAFALGEGRGINRKAGRREGGS